MRRLSEIAGYSFVFVVLVVIAGIFWLRTSLPTSEREISSSNLQAPVSVYFDDHSVPYIYADDWEDAAFALGFTHASDRLWQMEFQRRVGAGRLSEILGSRTLGVDRFMRMLGIYRAAETSLAGLEPATKKILVAYAAGINKWLASRRGALPLEFILLRHKPEPWTPADSLVWGKLMGLRLSGNFRTELTRLRALNSGHSLERLRELWPDYPENGPISGHPQQAATIPASQIGQLLAATQEIENRFSGASNVWVVGGEKSTTGRPILANDPHLGFGAPILWYLAKIVTPDGVLAGATVPGVPMHILGHTDSLAWGMTTTQTDLQDLYVETVDPTTPHRYLTPEGPKEFEVRTETIGVRGQAPVQLQVRSTHRGPVISDLNPAGAVISLKAVFLQPEDSTAQAILKLNRAKNASGVRLALRDFRAPQQNVMYADNQGDYGFISPGVVPIRKSEFGFVPGDGASGNTDWVGSIPFDELPQSSNPTENYLLNANNKVIPEDYPYFVTHDWATPYRAQQIGALLRGRTKFSQADFSRMQMDSTSLAAADLLPLMLRFETGRPDIQKVMARLSRWDGQMDLDRPEPLIFDRWLRALNQDLYADDFGEMFGEVWGLRPIFVKNAISGRSSDWCDNTTTDQVESCGDVLESSLSRALKELTKESRTSKIDDWRWRDHHVGQFRHQVLGRVPILGTFTNLKVPTSGGNFTVNRGTTEFRNSRSPHDHIHGAGFRGVYDLANLTKSRFVIATGQSGNPLSRHYRDFVNRWARGGHILLDRARGQLERNYLRRYALNPS